MRRGGQPSRSMRLLGAERTEMDGNAIGSAMARFVLLLAVAAFALGVLAMWGLPKLWELVKPFIHAVTA